MIRNSFEFFFVIKNLITRWITKVIFYLKARLQRLTILFAQSRRTTGKM